MDEIAIDISLDEWFDLWMKTYKAYLAEYTISGYYVAYHHYSQILGFREIRDLRSLDFLGMYYDMVEMGHTNTTVRQTKMVMKQCLEQAVVEGLIQKNPVPKRFDKGAEITEKLALNNAEVYGVMEYMDSYSFEHTELVAFLIATGLRNGEIRALCWENVDFNKCCINVVRSLRDSYKNGVRTTVVDTPKTKRSRRKVPMSEDVKILLQTVREKKVQLKQDVFREFGELIFPVDGREMTNNDLYQIFVKLVDGMRAKGYQIREFTPQIARRTFATLCDNSGVDIKAISEYLGHSCIRTTINFYIKPDIDDLLADEIEKFENFGGLR